MLRIEWTLVSERLAVFFGSFTLPQGAIKYYVYIYFPTRPFIHSRSGIKTEEGDRK